MSYEQNMSSQPPTLPPVNPQSAQGPAGPWASPGGLHGQPPGGPWQPAPQPGPAPAKRSSGWRILLWLFLLSVLGGSILLNLVLLGTLGAGFETQGVLATHPIESGEQSQTIAVYTVAGVIEGKAVAQFAQFRDAVAYDPDVKAVVLRVNSPGGGVTASDQICNMVQEIQNNKPVVVSMGSVAASGGYYISAPADEIIAEQTTVTGSIGVITGWVVFKGTLEKIGAEAFTIKSSHADTWKDEMSPTATPQEYQIEHLRGILDQMQARFEKVVTDGRGMRLNRKTETVRVTGADGEVVERKTIEPFNGKIYLADKAKQLGLIDDIGYEEDAIDRARMLASLDNANVVRYARRRTLMETLFDGQAETPGVKIDTNLIDTLQTPRFMMLWKVE